MAKSTESKLALFACLMALSTWAAADAPADAKRGEQLFLQVGCSGCHGTRGAGGGWAGPTLAPTPLPIKAFFVQLRNPRREMPPYFPSVLSDTQIRDIHAYLSSIKPGRTPQQIRELRAP